MARYKVAKRSAIHQLQTQKPSSGENLHNRHASPMRHNEEHQKTKLKFEQANASNMIFSFQTINDVEVAWHELQNAISPHQTTQSDGGLLS